MNGSGRYEIGPSITVNLGVVGCAVNVARLVERVEEARICGDPFLLELAESTRRLAWSMYAGITVGAIEVQEISSIDICRQLLEAMGDGDSLWGGNILSPRALWNTPQGKVYHEKSLEKAKKINIQRVFAFGPMDPTDPAEKRAIDEIRETLCQQLEAGIKVWVSTFDKLPPASAAEFIIANLKENNRDRRIVGWIYAKGRGPIVSSRFSANPFEVERAESMFREMKEAAGGEEGWIRSEEELDRVFEKVSPRGEA